jgi:peptidoglycan/LPS O-acetylase OafA/YrhL
MPMRAERAPSHASFLAQRRFASLNGLRCLAILEVIWHHASGRRWGTGVGVDLSFAISGFLTTTLLVREFSKTGRIDVRELPLARDADPALPGPPEAR